MSFDQEYPNARVKEPGPAHWPDDVRSISMDGLDLLGVDSKGRFYWDGQPVEMANRLRLTRVQAGFAIIAALAALTMAVLDVLRFAGYGSGI